ncbi:uncharacterized protein LOC119614125 [Lucilia sericata]|uniref:uncharacterized protein LOC119614125 n=1 Tax=Lucilia sericata TaxID=13632 RepID=UPI0018A8476F|nr:uncharacterized protein LOC119614125 [Lucilia sericata]
MLYNINSLFLLVFLIQSAYSIPLEDSYSTNDASLNKPKENLLPQQKLLHYVGTNFLLLAEEYATKYTDISRAILKDETLLSERTPEVEKFKNKLIEFVENYENQKNLPQNMNIMEIFANTTEYYYKLTEEEHTMETRLILKLLNKYNYKEIEKDIAKDFEPFIENFEQFFEEYEGHWNKALRDWYTKFKTLKEFEHKLEAFSEFMELV